MNPVKKLSFCYPIYNVNTWHLLEMFCVMCDDSQMIVSGCCTNQNVKIANNFSFACRFMSNFCVISYYLANRQYSKRIFYCFWLF